jgi:hypothetical protein
MGFRRYVCSPYTHYTESKILLNIADYYVQCSTCTEHLHISNKGKAFCIKSTVVLAFVNKQKIQYIPELEAKFIVAKHNFDVAEKCDTYKSKFGALVEVVQNLKYLVRNQISSSCANIFKA